MTRLQKKCLYAATGAHLLALVVLFCSGFISTKPKVDDSQTLDVVPSTLVDAALQSGVQNPTPPAPQPPTPTPPQPVAQPVPLPPPPKPPEPVKQVEPVKPVDEVKPADKTDEPLPKPPKKPHEIKVDLTPTTRDAKKVADAAKAQADADAKARKDAEKRAKAFKTAMKNIEKNATTSTEVEIKGSSSVSYANYMAAVKKIYDDAWTPPDSMVSDDVTTKVSVTISRDGHVVSSHITSPSGDSSIDASVQRALDRVDFVAPFPEGATETERTFIINFNPQAKKLNG